MATVNPVVAPVQINAVSVPRLSWSGVVTGDTLVAFGISAQAGVAGAIQIDGTFGGASVALEGSNDGVTYFTLKDLSGSNISASSAALFDFTTAALYLRPAVSGGSANALNITVLLRG